ncbi:hypothetical protein Rhal01_00227 [Rubritalea halochordaticola]|uniref:Uncharacterized protein n=1 Tax=Rubritalea halochordaticola TaxID=714537 RepID=A0ABP9UUC2_9BACT
MQAYKYLLAFCLMLLPIKFCGAQETLLNERLKNGSEITVTSLFSQIPPLGYLPVQVRIDNRLSNKSSSWSLTAVSNKDRFYRAGSQMTSRFTCSCPAGESRSYDLVVPLVKTFAYSRGYGSSSSSLNITGVDQAGKKVHGFMSSHDESSGIVAVSQAIERANDTKISSPSSYHGGSSSLNTFDPVSMSSDWRAYSGLQAMYLKQEEWDKLSAEVKNAILQWNRTGGELSILTTNPETTLGSLDTDSVSGTTAKRSFGTVSFPLKSSGDVLPTKELKNIEGLLDSNNSHLDDFDNSFSNLWGLYHMLPEKNSSPAFFILILLAFGILVGPINVFVFARKGQRHKLFFTTPIISTIACTLLIVLIIVQDGTGGKGVRCTIMEICSANENTAYIEQEQIARTGVMFGTEFTLSDSTCITPVATEANRMARVTTSNEGGNSQYTLSRDDKSLVANGDWFQSRSEIGHYLTEVRPNRGTLNFSLTGASPRVNSSLDFPVQEIMYCDSDGKWWKAEALDSGDTSEMTPIGSPAVIEWINTQKSGISTYMRNKLDVLLTRKGCFIAVTDQGPAIETIDSIDWNSRTIITGAVN